MNPRLQKLKQYLIKHNLDAILISSVPHIIYLTGYSAFSTDEREGFLLLTKKNNYLITSALYKEAVISLKDFKLLEIGSHKTPLSKVLEKLSLKNKIKTLGFEAHNLSVAEYKTFSKYFTLKPTELSELRLIKEQNEIKEIENACILGDRVLNHLLGEIHEGVTEKELAFEIEFFIKQEGHDISFRPIVAFGSNAATPHHLTSNKKLTKNNFVLMDFGAKVNNYCSDMTRTVFFGKANAQQKKMYQAVLEAQSLAIKHLKSSIQHLGSRVDKIARDHIIKQGFPTIPHSLGHGIGIEVHEAPRLSPTSKAELKPGMVFSIEPGIYQSKVGGVRIEDLVVLEKTGLRLLTKSPRELIEL